MRLRYHCLLLVVIFNLTGCGAAVTFKYPKEPKKTEEASAELESELSIKRREEDSNFLKGNWQKPRRPNSYLSKKD